MSRVRVVGPGAIGSVLAALLAEAGHEVELRGRSAPLGSVRLEGGGYGADRDLALATLRAPPDLVVLATKTQDLEEALRQHAPHVGDAPLLVVQNGLAQDEIVARFSRERRETGETRESPASPTAPSSPPSPSWAGAVTALDAHLVKPGVVQVANRGTLVVGGPAADAVDAILRTAVATERTPDLRGARWTKLLVNLGNVLPAITGLPFQRTSRHPGLGRAHVALVREGLAVARAEGVELRPIPWTDPRLVRLLARLPLPLARRVYAARVRRVLGPTPAYGSTWQSMSRGGSLETEWLNGEVVRRGARLGLATPVNERAWALVEKRERLPADETARRLLHNA